MKKIAVLGAGMVGSVIARDLANSFSVTSIDIDERKLLNLKNLYPLEYKVCDISDSGAVKKIVKDFDLVISAVPGFMGFKTLKTVIEAGKNVVDISFFDEDPFLLEGLAKKNNVTAVIDCGVAPGLSNLILGRHNSTMEINSYECYVGGLPFKRILPFQYKAPFSPVDVIEEYTRPARFITNGKRVVMPALSGIELLNFEPIGTLEAFNSDGLRTLLHTMKIPNMKEKTLRYPGHAELMNFLKAAGFFNKKEIEIKGKMIKPVDFTSGVLFPHWKLENGEHEFTAMLIKIKGTENGELKEYNYKLFDRYDNKNNVTSMSRTTGYTCSSVARQVLNNNYSVKGISPPEFIGADESCYNKIKDDLKTRGIILQTNINYYGKKE